MLRTIERDLVDQFGKNDAAPFGWFRPYRAVICWVYYWLKFRSKNVAALMNSAATDYDISAVLPLTSSPAPAQMSRWSKTAGP
jgi:hypothetical protein